MKKILRITCLTILLTITTMNLANNKKLTEMLSTSLTRQIHFNFNINSLEKITEAKALLENNVSEVKIDEILNQIKKIEQKKKKQETNVTKSNTSATKKKNTAGKVADKKKVVPITKNTTTKKTNTATKNSNNKSTNVIDCTTKKSYQEELICYVNQERRKNGLNELKLDSTLNSYASIRAKEIEKKFDHTRPNNKLFNSIIKINYSTAGENIAAGQYSAKKVFDAWMNSPGHKKNMLCKDYKKMGIALYQDIESEYVYYWAQLFIG